MTPLIIIRSPRSGTTFLAQMVSRFFDLHVCRDIRDAREAVLSMRRARVTLERNWHFGARDWAAQVQAGRKVGQEIGPARHADRVPRNLSRVNVGIVGRYRLEVLMERWRARVRV